MNPVQPKSLGDAYPALCNFLKLTSLTLAVPQLALTVQVGDDWRHSGVMNYGQMSALSLRQVLASQPVVEAMLDCDQLTLSTHSCAPGSRAASESGAEPGSEPAAETTSVSVLVGHLHSANGRYHLTFYVPGLDLEALSEVQIKILQYLSQQLLLCLTLAQPVSLAPRPAAISESQNLSTPLDFLSRVVALSPTGLTYDHLQRSQPRLADLVARLQACLSYPQLGKLLATYLPYFFPHQSGRLVLFDHSPGAATGSFKVLTEWGDDKPLGRIDQQCCYAELPQTGPSLGIGHECHRCQIAPCPGQPPKCIVLGMVNDTTCIVQLTQLEAESFNSMQTALLKKLSEQILYVMQRLLLLEDLQDQALKDPLTGLLNRRHAETALTRLCQSGQQGSVILIDIDHFKLVNDTYGHQAGDAVLQNIGMLLRGHVRSQDVVCRYGGEEFCMVLLATSTEVALKRAEKIRRAVKYITNTFNGQMLPPLTISLGVSSFPDHGETPHTLVTLADKALYWAKNNGRDRAVSVDHMRSAL